ncbi:unnamed protein product [Larinioides sclopetarius]|uniref:Uncharacterized protein n=2 Tax=Larinioides sclopetarius TaxID=280406 RepID=A0AAV2ARL0_9ARAC
MLAGADGEEELSPYWDPADSGAECDCPPPPPPRFLIPPPPAPPASPLCRGGEAAADLHFCQMEPVGAEFTQTAFPSLPIIAVCSSVVLVAVLVASFLLWKHKRKVQNFLPCKTHHQGRCDMGGSAGITYDDVLINHHPTRLPNHLNPSLNPDTNTLTPIELLDVKYGNYVQQHADSLTRTNFTLPPGANNATQQQQQQQQAPTQRTRQHRSNHSQKNHHRGGHHKKDHQFHPIYEEVSANSDDNKVGRSYDSDIEDSEVEGRTVGSEDEFAEDELSVAGEYPLNPEESQPCSATSSLQGSTGGDLYPDVVTGSSERFCSDGSPSEARTLKGNFRSMDLGSGHNKLTHSLERNKDGHPSNSFQAKQNYYLNKSMLGPDFTYPEGTMDGSSGVSPSGDMVQQPDQSQYPSSRAMGSSLNFIPALLQQQQQQRGGPMPSRSASNSPPPPPYVSSSTNPRPGQGSSNSGIISALYNPQIVSPGGQQGSRIPEALLRELTFKMPSATCGGGTLPAVAPMSSRSLPVPPSCRAGGSGVLFTVENPYPVQQAPPPSLSRTRSGSATEFTSSVGRGGYHQYPHHAVGGGRPPTPPPPENIYASIDDVGPFTIDGGRHRSPFVPGRKGSADQRNTFGRSVGGSGRTHKSAGDKFQANNVPNRHPNPEGGSYGDIRPIYDSRTACS